MKKEKLSIQRFENSSGTISFRVFGYLHGERVRRNFATREEAAAEKTTLEIRAHQVAAGYRPVLTTLTEAQAREAESVFGRVVGKAQSLTFYVDLALENYTPPETAKRLKAGIVDYLAARKRELDQDQLSQPQYGKIHWELKRLEKRFKDIVICDASGDGIVGFLAGAAFRMGAEAREEFGEGFAPVRANSELLGHSLYFYSKDTGRPVKFTPPSFALTDITKIPRWRQFNATEHGCKLWWIEHGGLLDTVHDTERIKWELWQVVYGVWNHIKNSGQFPEAENLTLEWIGHIPGKRESRRFEGDYILRQQDIVEQRTHPDAVAHGGWAIDLHPAAGVFSEKPGCTQWHAKGVYQIPYRCLYSRNITNLFLAGRIISASHVAFGSTRVMATVAHAAQAVGLAAALCTRDRLQPRDLAAPARMAEPAVTSLLRIELTAPNPNTPAALFAVRCYSVP